MPVHVRVEEGGWLLPLPRVVLVHVLQAMLEAATARRLCVELYVLRDGRMAEENQLHMGCPGPTNVVSFPAEESPQAQTHGGLAGLSPVQDAVPGTLLLSVDTVHRECVLYGQDVEAHMLRLLAHGLGHVLGHDHGPAMDAVCSQMWVAGGAVCDVKLVAEDY